MNKNVVIGIVVVVSVAAGSFWSGIQYQKSQTPARGGFAQGGFQGAAGGRGARAGAGGGFAAGSIVSKDSTSITIQLGQGGGTRIVLISPSTEVGKMVTGSSTDLNTDESVTVQGTSNSDGSLTAQTIQIRPAGSGFGRDATSTPRGQTQ